MTSTVNATVPDTIPPESSTTSSPAPSYLDQMEYFQQRCSICFDAQCEFCLRQCRDQFCRECFGRYVAELVKGGWGIARVEIKCPVCSEPLERHEWSRYVPYKVVETFDRQNQPFKALTRTCPHCAHEQGAALHWEGTREERAQRLQEAFDLLRELVDARDFALLHTFHSLKQRYLAADDHDAKADDQEVTISHIYHTILPRLLEAIERKQEGPSQEASSPTGSKRRRVLSESHDPVSLLAGKSLWEGAAQWSTLMISLEQDTSAWRELQFEQIAHFPQVTCSACQKPFCFQCGASQWHWQETCMQAMERLLWARHTAPRHTTQDRHYCYDSTASAPRLRLAEERPRQIPEESEQMLRVSEVVRVSEEEAATLRWKLENSKPCPRCRTLIQRDDGCNKVDCMLCGFRFCWMCSSGWGEACGFYRCQLQTTPEKNTPTEKNSSTHAVENSPPELGVPNVERIQARLRSHSQAI